MIGLADIRDYLKTVALTDATWTIGRFEAEKTNRVCVYQRPEYSPATVALSGSESTKTLVKYVQVLVHWNKNHKETELAALSLYNALRYNPRPTIGGRKVSYLDLQLPEPVDLGSDENGIFERVLWLDIYFEGE